LHRVDGGSEGIDLAGETGYHNRADGLHVGNGARAMAFDIKFDSTALEELRDIRVFDRRRIEQAIEEQLTHEPGVATRNRKPIVEGQAPFSHALTLWELRIGDFRVFYNVIEDVVFVRAIRAKPPHKTTEQVL
jgi:mRNA-degrading endonuclease RelE of RelBE toxin-antitoxin system